MNLPPKPKTSDARRWRKALRAIGAGRLNVTMSERGVGKDADSPVFGVVRVPPYPTRAFVEAWLGAGRRRFAACPIAVAVLVAVVALSTTAWKNWGTISHHVGWP